MELKKKLRKFYKKIPKAVYFLIPLVCVFSVLFSDISYAATSGGLNLEVDTLKTYTFYWRNNSHCFDLSTLTDGEIFRFSESHTSADDANFTIYNNLYVFYPVFYTSTSYTTRYGSLNLKKSAYTDEDYQYISVFVNIPSSSIYYTNINNQDVDFGFFISFGSPDLTSSTIYTYTAVQLEYADTYTNAAFSANNIYYYGDIQSNIYFGQYLYTNQISDYCFVYNPIYWYFSSRRTVTFYVNAYSSQAELLEDILSQLEEIDSSLNDINSTIDSLSDDVEQMNTYLGEIQNSIDDYSAQLNSILSYLSSIDETSDYTSELVYNIDSYVKSIYSRLNTTNSYLSSIDSKLDTANNFLEDIDYVINLIYNFLVDEDLADTSELDNTTSELEDSQSVIDNSLNFDEGDFESNVSDADAEDMDSGISIINFFFGLDDVWYLFIVIFGWMFVAVILFKAL